METMFSGLKLLLGHGFHGNEVYSRAYIVMQLASLAIIQQVMQ